MSEPDDPLIIARKRKKYKFAQFKAYPNCREIHEWEQMPAGDNLTLELGAGSGFFSVELAARYPERTFVAMDVKADRLQRGAKLALERGLPNILFLRAHADHLTALFAPQSISNLWITFPDPQPKKRSAKHRLTHPVFLGRYRTCLRYDGGLYVKTDDHSLFDWSLEQLVADGWCIEALTYDLHKRDGYEDAKILTTYEQRFMSEGLPTHYVQASLAAGSR